MNSAAVQRCTIISTFCYFQKYDTEVYQMCTIALHDKQNKMYIAICISFPDLINVLVYDILRLTSW